jgi:hypothetical protein
MSADGDLHTSIRCEHDHLGAGNQTIKCCIYQVLFRATEQKYDSPPSCNKAIKSVFNIFYGILFRPNWKGEKNLAIVQNAAFSE